MNGSPAHMAHNMSAPPRRSGNSPSGGLVPTIMSSLRSVVMYNHNTLNQAISQLEAIGDVQNELVNARSAHAQASKDLQICMERNAAQNIQLQQTQDELRITAQNLHGAREQLRQVEARLAAVDGRTQSGQGAQRTKASTHFASLESALGGANQQIFELTQKLQMATSAAIAAQHSDNPVTEAEVLTRSSLRVQALEKRLAAILGLSDQDLTLATNRLEAFTSPNSNAVPIEIFAYFKALRGEFDAILNAAQSYTSRNAMLEATLTTIRDLQVGAVPMVLRSTVTELRPTVGMNPPTQESPIEGEVEMDIERTEAARMARQNSSSGPSTRSQPAVPPQQRPPSIQPPDVSQPVKAASSTPTQPTFLVQKTDSPQRKRQRTLTGGGTPEPLPRDNILHVYIRLVTTTYRIASLDGGNTPGGQKQLVCKLCESRHKDQPDFQVATFLYDRDTPPVAPSLADAETTRARVQPWIDHIQQKHQKIYNTVMERARPRSSTNASTSSAS